MSEKPSLTMSFQGFLDLEHEERQALYEQHGLRHRDAVGSVLLTRAWAVFVGDGGEPVNSAADIASYPTENELMALGQQHNLPIFPYTKPQPPESLTGGTAGPG